MIIGRLKMYLSYESAMKIQIFLAGILVFSLIGCGEKETEEEENEPAVETPQIECPSSWTEENGIWLDPSLCVAWSNRASSSMNWDDANDYCNGLSEGGFSEWTLPTIGQLTDLAVREHPLEEVEGDLWSSTLDQTGLIETTNLMQPGMTILLDKSSSAFVYCVFP